MKTLSIIIPVYNEEKTIINVLKRIEETKIKNVHYDIIVINDGSTDSTLDVIKKNPNLYSQLISYDKNKGKGYAVKSGLIKSKGDYIIFQDADLEYDPLEFKKFLNIFEKYNPDCIIGTRKYFDEYTRSHNILNKIGNDCLTFLFNILYNTTFTDIYSCYLSFKRNSLNFESLKTTGWEQHAEILSKIVKNGEKFFEVRVNYNGRNSKEGKKIKFYHIFAVIKTILKERFKK